MTHADMQTSASSNGAGHFATVRELFALREFGGGYFKAAPVLLLSTLIGRGAEGISVGLIVLFLEQTLGENSGGETSNPLLQRFADWVSTITGGDVLLLAAVILAVTLVRVAADGVAGIVDSRVYCEIADKVRRRIHKQYFDVSYDYVAQHDQADLVNVIENESETIPGAFQKLKDVILDLVAVGVFGVMILLISWQVGVIAAVGAGFLLVVARLLSQPIQRLNGLAITARRRMMQQILVGLQGMRPIRAFAQEPAEKLRFARASRRVRDTHRRIDILQTFIDPVNELGYLVLLAALVLAGGRLGISLTATVTALALLYRVQPHASAMQGALIELLGKSPHYSVVRSVLDTSDKAYPAPGHLPAKGVSGDIRFRDVSLTYPNADTPSLNHASFSIPAGATTAILGESGAGKTTIVNLLLRLYAPDVGSITVGDTDLADLRRDGWLRSVALAGQDCDLVEGTVATNIRLSRPAASMEAVRDAARVAGILGHIDGLPGGFSTWIGERGLKVSGGQRQRIGLARALLCKPDLLILDEAMSALEESLERDIRAALAAHLPGCTLVLITHRLHTLDTVDHAVWLERGHLVEEGDPRSMARLARAQ
jgi:ATP-binding cassette, subfamily B, bacterial MsbA